MKQTLTDRYGRYKWLLAALAAVLLALAFLQMQEDRPTVRIGVLHSLTGTLASSEAPLVDAIRLAVEEANAEGGVNGKQIEMVVEDCRSDAVYCAGRAEKLIVQDGVQALFGCWTSSCRKAVKAVVEKHHHLLFYPLQYEGLEHSTDIFYTGAVPNQQVIPLLAWAMQERGKRVYLIGSDYVYPRTINRLAAKLLQAHGGLIAAERYVPLGEQHMQDIAREIAGLHPDFVLNTLNGDSNRYFFRALREAGVSATDIPVFSTSLAEAEVAAIGPELAAGHYAAWNYFQSVQGDENRSFIERFRRRFGQDRVLDDPMEASFIGVKLWVNAMRAIPVQDIPAVKIALMQQTLSAPEGIVAVDAQTRHLWKPVRIGRARPDGQFDIVWQSGRSVAPAPFPYFIPYNEQAEMAGGTR